MHAYIIIIKKVRICQVVRAGVLNSIIIDLNQLVINFLHHNSINKIITRDENLTRSIRVHISIFF